MRRIITLTTFLFFSACLVLRAQDIVISNVNLVDVKAGKLVPNSTVTISGGRIKSVETGTAIAGKNGATLVDGTGKYLMPGMIDAHIHFFQSGGLYTRPDAADLTARVPYAAEREQGFRNTSSYLERYLRLGITTVADVGGPFSNFRLRDSLSEPGKRPNILVTGPLFSTISNPATDAGDPPIIKVSTTADVDRLFNRMLSRRPDFIKVWYLAGQQNPASQTYPLIKHLGDLCRRHGLKLAVHATELETAELAVDAGANILVHSVEDVPVSDAFIEKLKRNKVAYIPTLIVGDNYGKVFAGKLDHHPQDLARADAALYGTLTDLESMDPATWPPVIKWYRKNGVPAASTVMGTNLKKLAEAGVTIVTGTDAGNIGTMHASSYLQELEAMQRAGLSAAQLLRASTIDAAAAFGRESLLGSIEKGKTADLLLLGSNPLEQLANLNTIELIVKDGTLIQAGSLLRESPEAVVQRQLNAYNARNIDAFLATYSPDIEIFDESGKLLMKGHEQMRKSYSGMFSTLPNLYCQITSRVVNGNQVTDREKVRAGEETLEATAIYEVENGLIRKVTFRM